MDVEGWLPEPRDPNVAYRDRSGATLREGLETDLSGLPRVLVLRGLPPGPGFVALARNLLPADPRAGEEVEARFPLRNPRRLLVEFFPRRDLLGEDGGLDLHATISRGRNVVVEESYPRLRRRRDGSCLFATALPPGDYTLTMQACGGKEVPQPVRVEEAETTRIRVESP